MPFAGVGSARWCGTGLGAGSGLRIGVWVWARKLGFGVQVQKVGSGVPWSVIFSKNLECISNLGIP